MSILNRVWPFSEIERQRHLKEYWYREAQENASAANTLAQWKRKLSAAGKKGNAEQRAKRDAMTAKLAACRP